MLPIQENLFDHINYTLNNVLLLFLIISIDIYVSYMYMTCIYIDNIGIRDRTLFAVEKSDHFFWGDWFFFVVVVF